MFNRSQQHSAIRTAGPRAARWLVAFLTLEDPPVPANPHAAAHADHPHHVELVPPLRARRPGRVAPALQPCLCAPPQTHNRPPNWAACEEKPAATYSPRPLRAKYHQR